jgi:hypothetical protein
MYLSAEAANGTGSSGGGKVIVCRNAHNGAIENSMLLDLYEAVHIYGLQLHTPLTNIESELQRFLEDLEISTVDNPQPVSNESLTRIANIVNNLQFTDITLTAIGDTGNAAAAPAGCSLEQLAIYNDVSNKITVQKEIWNSLDSMNRAALVAHELIYRQHRVEGGETTSRIARRYVGMLFSTTPPAARKSFHLNRMSFCTAEDVRTKRNTRFFITPEQSGSTSSLVFDTISGVALLPFSVELPIPVAVRDTENKFGATYVTRAPVEFQGAVPLNSAPYEGYKMELNYKNFEPFAIKFVDSNNNIVWENKVKFCSER